MKVRFIAPLIFILSSVVLLSNMSKTALGQPGLSAATCSDLLSSLSINVTSPQIDQEVTIQIAVANQGDATSDRFRVYLYIDPTEQPPTVGTADTTSFGTFGLDPQSELIYEYDYTFTQTGTHVIYSWVDRDGGVANECDEGNNLAVLTVPIGIDPGCTPDSYENGSSDDFCSTAPSITTDGVIQRHNLCTQGDVDWVRFQGTAGVKYTIIAGNAEDDAEVELELLDSCSANPLQNPLPTLGNGVSLQQSLTQSGTYYVQVKHHSVTYGPKTGYDLSIQASCSIDEYEPNNQCMLAHEIYPGDDSGLSSFCGVNDSDWLFWQAMAGVTYHINTAKWGGKSQPVLTLYEDCDSVSLTQSAARESLSWTATQSGPIYIRMMNADPQEEGLDTNYEVDITVDAQTGDIFEPNDNASQAKPLLIGAATSAHSFSFPGDQDWFIFQAEATHTYRFETVELAAATDTNLCLYGSNAAIPLVCDDDSGAGLGSKLLWKAPTTGQYYLHVRNHTVEAGGTEATYKLQTTESATLCDADTYEPDNNYGQAHEIPFGDEGQLHTICGSKDVDWIRFWIQTPGVYEIKASTQGGDADPIVSLYDVDGQTLLFRNDDYAPGLSARILWPFTQTGVYYLQIGSFNEQATGNGTEYHLQVHHSQEFPTPLPTTPPPPTPTFTPSPTPTATATATPLPEATPTPSGPIKTLIVVNRARMSRFYKAQDLRDLAFSLKRLSQYSAAPGLTVNLEEHFAVTQAYDAWDRDPSNVQKANATAGAIHSILWYFLDQYPQIEYIVLIGDDRIIPHRREAHKISALGEKQYAEQELAADSTIGQALRQEVVLFDDFYASRSAQQVKGQAFYLPEKAIGRLIEEPREIIQSIERFLRHGSIERSTATIITNDRLVNQLNSTQQICDQLRSHLETTFFCQATADPWGADAFRAWHLQTNQPIDIHLLNIHGSHWTMQMGDRSFLDTDAIATSPTLSGSMVILIASHSALAVAPTEPHPLDWPQFYTQQGAIFIGNSATELFLSEQGVGLSHKLFTGLARQFWTSQTVGQALVTAKQNYWQEARKPDLTDRHVLHQTMLFGLPMYQLPRGFDGPNEFPSVLRTADAIVASANESQTDTLVTGDLQLSLQDSFNTLTLSGTTAGNYYALDGHVNWKPNDAGQPLYFIDLDETALGLQGPARGLLWLGGVYTDVADANLLMPQIIVGDQASASQTQTGVTPAQAGGGDPFPAQLDPAGKRLIVEWGHYDATADRQRLYGDMTLELTFSSSEDTLAPTVQHSAAQVTPGGIVIKLEAGDASGIRRVVATYTGGDGLFQSIDLTYQPDMAKWVGVIPGLREAAWFAQVVDGAGNVAYVLDKGKFFQASYVASDDSPQNDLYLPIIIKK